MTVTGTVQRAGRRGLELVGCIVAAILVAVALIPERADAAERTVRLELEPSAAECTAFAPLDCSYLLARNGNQPAPDASEPDASEPTFLNMAEASGPSTVDAVVADDGTVTVPDGDVTPPALATTLPNDLVDEIALEIRFEQTAAWTGTYNEASGDLDLTTPMTLSVRATCDPVAPTLCAAVWGPQGNMGTWRARVVNPFKFTTGQLDVPPPPTSYGPAWVPTLAQEGSPVDAATGSLTLAGTGLVLHALEPGDCVDPDSVSCTNPAIAALLTPDLNAVIGAINEEETPVATIPGAIDARLTFKLAEPLSAQPRVLDFGEQPLATSGAAQAVSLTAPHGEVVPVHWIDVDGGAEDDFVLRSRCESIDADSPCEVETRFVPSETGPRATELRARITNPFSGARETIKLADLSGLGAPKPPRPPAPVIAVGHSAKVGSGGRAKVARLRCPDGQCEVKRTRAKLWIGGRKERIKLRTPARVRKGKPARARVVLSPRAHRRLKRSGSGVAIARIVIVSSNGERTTKRFGIKLRLK